MDMLAKVKELAAAPTICPEAKEAQRSTLLLTAQPTRPQLPLL